MKERPDQMLAEREPLLIMSITPTYYTREKGRAQMNILHYGFSSIMVFALAALSGSASAAQPPDVVNSDSAFNTAMGTQALLGLTGGGSGNTSSGYQSLTSNTTGSENTASGAFALNSNTTAIGNSAFGYFALNSNSTGYANTAVGTGSLAANTQGTDNTAIGFQALQQNASGYQNSAWGVDALFSNTTGNYNVAAGVEALLDNTTGNANLAFGLEALHSNTTGSNNIGVGYAGGYSLTTGSNNIDIGNVGVAGESGAIRIGAVSKQTKAYIAGIYGTSVSGSAVMISSTGQLGVTVSSERFKTSIASMGDRSARLEQLRPVTFHLKTDPHGTLQYGLIAEEVARVYPELVVRDSSGRIDGVRYDELAPMLLNEVQQQAARIHELEEQQMRDRQAQISELRDLKQELHSALSKREASDQLVAGR
jgi:hypothetical protein